MFDIFALKAKIENLRNEVVHDSITPVRLGTILLEMLDKLRAVYREGLPEDIEQALETARTMLDKAEAALDVLEKTIALLLEKTQVTIVDRGQYDPNLSYFFAELNPETGVVETSDVWFCGCRFRCLVSGTTQQPSWKATEWMFVEGNPEFAVEFAPVNTVFKVNAIDLELQIIASIYNQDVTDDIMDMDIVWTRYSEDMDGTVRSASDAVWNNKHIGAGKCVHITTADIDYNGHLPRVVRFTATVTLRDGLDATAAISLTDIN